MTKLFIEPTGEKDHGPCDCCGRTSRCVWGLVQNTKRTVAAYYVHWTVGGVAEHYPNFDLIIGKWGKGATAEDRVLVSLRYRWTAEDGPSFMVIDSAGRPSAESELVGRALTRAEVIGQPIAKQAFDIVDTILAQDARIAELLGGWLEETEP